MDYSPTPLFLFRSDFQELLSHLSSKSEEFVSDLSAGLDYILNLNWNHFDRQVGALLVLLVGITVGHAAGFKSIPSMDSGLSFTNHISPERYLTNQIPLNGSGVALGDVDGDGRIDVFLAGLGGGSELYRNSGNLRFQRVTSQAFPEGLVFDATGCALADIDGDGDLDLIVNSLGQGTRIYFNDGHGVFREGSRLNLGRAGMSLALADVDGDGDLDLYVTNYRLASMRDDPGAKFRLQPDGGQQRVVAYNGRSTAEPDLIGRFFVGPTGVKENGEPDVLFLNDGQGKFTPVDWTGGTFQDESGKVLASAPYDWGLSVMFRDLNGDGRPDLYVCNDFESPDRFWLNDTPPGGPLRFRAISALAMRHQSAFSMGMDVADLDRDGNDDFITVDMLSRNHTLRNRQTAGLPVVPSLPGVIDERPQFSMNALFRNRGDGTFAEIGRLAGLSASEWSWTPLFVDVDLDGYEDLLVTNGHELEMLDADLSDQANQEMAARRRPAQELLEMRRRFRRFDAKSAAFRNRGDFTFEDVSATWGFDIAGVAHGMAAADLDGDGDLDLVVNCLNGPARLYRNEATAPRLLVRLRSAGANTRAIGARISVRVGDGPAQTQELIAGGRYLSSDAAERTFALNPVWLGMTNQKPKVLVEVRWPSGRNTQVENSRLDPSLEIIEPSGDVAVRPKPILPTPWFSDVTTALRGHLHHDDPFDDFARQPLLPRSLAYLGPGVTWADVNGDGHDDLLVGGGTGGTLAVFQGNGVGEFRGLTQAPLQKKLGRDLTTILYHSGIILAGSANYEDGFTNGGALRVVDLAHGVSGDAVLHQSQSTAPLALADVDGDGIPEVFVGGRAQGGRYPQAVASQLLKQTGGRFVPVQRWESLGLVSGACFTDLDGDGRPELALALEWGPLKLYRNRNGVLEPWDPLIRMPGFQNTNGLALSALPGWWNSISAGDFDGDGRLDLVAGNWGRNHFFAGDPSRRPLRIRAPDLNGDGVPDPLISYTGVDGRELPLRKWDSWVNDIPGLRDTFPTRAAFGAADVTEIFGAAAAGVPVGLATWFDSVILLNRGDSFELHALPLEAQVAPVFGIVVADFDGDGSEDLFLAQNFFATDPEELRHDAGRGVLLRGDGRGGFETVPGQLSGVSVYGEGRGAATADYNEDGRPDLVVGQNSAPTRLFRNDTGKPGLRVRLLGPSGNPDAWGASLWMVWADDSHGPVRERHDGAGYWSVDSPVSVLAQPRPGRALEVRWPGGLIKHYPIPSGAKEVIANFDGTSTSR